MICTCGREFEDYKCQKYCSPKCRNRMREQRRSIPLKPDTTFYRWLSNQGKDNSDLGRLASWVRMAAEDWQPRPRSNGMATWMAWTRKAAAYLDSGAWVLFAMEEAIKSWGRKKRYAHRTRRRDAQVGKCEVQSEACTA